MSDELANASPNVNGICNWHLQQDCNWNATAGNCTQEYATGKTQEKTQATYILSELAMFLRKMTSLTTDAMLQVYLSTELSLFCCFLLTHKWQVLFMKYETKPTFVLSSCWFSFVLHEEYLSLVCEQKATKQAEFSRYSNRLVALHPWSGWSFFEETLPVQIEYTLLEFFPAFFQLHILVCSFLQLHSSCKPVANSSCKFYLHWGKHSQTQKLSKQILIRYQVSMSDELANASPNVNRICNWNLQQDCNWNATAGNCTQEYATGKTQEKTQATYILSELAMFLRKMTSLTTDAMLQVYLSTELSLFCCFLLTHKWQVLFMKYETKPTPVLKVLV